MAIKKEEIIATVAIKARVGRMTAEAVIDTFIGEIINSVNDGDSVNIKNFGIFESVRKAERPGRNIKAGKSVTIPAHIAPRFRPSKYFKEVVYRKVD